MEITSPFINISQKLKLKSVNRTCSSEEEEEEENSDVHLLAEDCQSACEERGFNIPREELARLIAKYPPTKDPTDDSDNI